MVIVIRGRRHRLWRVVDNEGEVLDFLTQSKRNANAALKLMRRLLKKQGWAPTRITTDKLRFYHVAIRILGLTAEQIDNKRAINLAENSHQPFRRREGAMSKYRDSKTLQKFASAHASIHNYFNLERHLSRREVCKEYRVNALAEWRKIEV